MVADKLLKVLANEAASIRGLGAECIPILDQDTDIFESDQGACKDLQEVCWSCDYGGRAAIPAGRQHEAFTTQRSHTIFSAL
jgi:hypothetical protein